MPVASCERIEGSSVMRGALFSRNFVPEAAETVIETGLRNVLTAVTSIVTPLTANACIVTVSTGDQAGNPPAGSIIISIWKLSWFGSDIAIEVGEAPFPAIDWIAIGDSK